MRATPPDGMKGRHNNCDETLHGGREEENRPALRCSEKGERNTVLGNCPGLGNSLGAGEGDDRREHLGSTGICSDCSTVRAQAPSQYFGLSAAVGPVHGL